MLSAEVDEVVFASIEGYLGVLPGHAPLLSALDVGEISYRVGSSRKFLACSGGFVEVQRGHVSILADTAEPADEIDVERAEASQERAKKRLGADASEHEFKRAAVSLRRAVGRISVSARGRKS